MYQSQIDDLKYRLIRDNRRAIKLGTPQALDCVNPMDFSALGKKPVALNSSPEINKSEHRRSNKQESLFKHTWVDLL